MTEPRKMPKLLKRLAVVVGTVAALWLLYRFIDPNGPNWTELKWTESVQLASGETVEIKRHIKFEQHRIWGMGGTWSAKHFEQSQIDLVEDSDTFLRWSAPLLPIYMDRDAASGEWIVIAVEDGDRLRPHNGAPCPPQWAFRLRSGTWYLQPVPKEFLGRRSNLLMDIKRGDDKRLIGTRFRANVEKRKSEQFSLPPRVFKDFTVVGGSTWLGSYCDKYPDPVFTREFGKSPDNTRLLRFPRMN